MTAPLNDLPLVLDGHDLAQLFPAFLGLDAQGRISAAGPSLLDHAGPDLVGADFFACFRVERPANIADLDSLAQRFRPITLRMISRPAIRLRGVALKRTDCLWLMLGHMPDLDRPPEGLTLGFADFSPIDGTLDMLLAAEMRGGQLTEARAHAAALEEQRQTAERANEAKSAFLATMSHEIRTPMNGVLGLAEMLADTGLTVAQREMLDLMTASGRLLMDTLNDVLDVSKIESGKMDLEETVFDVEDLVQGVAAVFAPVAAAKGLRLRMTVTATQPWRLGDPVRIRQILVNLISNAIKFTDAGEVDLAAALRRSGGGTVLEIVVRDSGIGMSGEAMARLFKPFVQADGSTTRRFGGTGLGLAIAKLLCGQMGGDIRVESRLGRGSVFTAVIPLPEAAAPALEVEREAPDSAAQSPTPHVLVVEDNPTNLFVLSLFLRKLGMTFDTAQNGAEALTAWERRAYDIVLMDIEMPVLDGIETTRELRRREHALGRGRTPIIALSADAMLESRARAGQVGMDEFATKPIDLDRLQALIRGQLARRAPACAGSIQAGP